MSHKEICLLNLVGLCMQQEWPMLEWNAQDQNVLFMMKVKHLVSVGVVVESIMTILSLSDQ